MELLLPHLALGAYTYSQVHRVNYLPQTMILESEQGLWMTRQTVLNQSTFLGLLLYKGSLFSSGYKNKRKWKNPHGRLVLEKTPLNF